MTIRPTVWRKRGSLLLVFAAALAIASVQVAAQAANLLRARATCRLPDRRLRAERNAAPDRQAGGFPRCRMRAQISPVRCGWA